MPFYSIWPYIIGTAALTFLASTPLFRTADVPATTRTRRIDHIDGLRGFLAIAVFFHHGALYHQYLSTGRWDVPTGFYGNIGPTGVAMFFMITAFLFWQKLLNERANISFLSLYIGRAFRIVPLYLVLIALVVVFALIKSDFRLNEGPIRLAVELAKWASGGIFYGQSLNGIDVLPFTAGVTWSHQYEWFFYASLIATAYAARRLSTGLLFSTVGTAIIFVVLLWKPAHFSLACILLFFFGMMIASFRQTRVRNLESPDSFLKSLFAILLIAIAVTRFSYFFQAIPILFIAVAFWLIVSGASLFGLLRTRAARRLGDISYGIYLLQGPVLALSFAPSILRAAALVSPVAHWSIVMVAAALLLGAATIVHGPIERAGIAAGRRACHAAEQIIWRHALYLIRRHHHRNLKKISGRQTPDGELRPELAFLRTPSEAMIASARVALSDPNIRTLDVAAVVTWSAMIETAIAIPQG